LFDWKWAVFFFPSFYASVSSWPLSWPFRRIRANSSKIKSSSWPALSKLEVINKDFIFISNKKTNFVSSWIKLWSTGTSTACSSPVFCWLDTNSSCRDGEGVGGGFGWVNVNGNSTAKSL